MKRQMLRHVVTGEIVSDNPSVRSFKDEYEPVEVELHPRLFRTDAQGRRFDRFGNTLDPEVVAVDTEFEVALPTATSKRGRKSKGKVAPVTPEEIEDFVRGAL